MKKVLSFLGALIALCLTFSVSAQTLLYDAAGQGTSFTKVGGSQNYALNLNGNSVVDGKIVITDGQKAANITINPAINGTIGKGLTVVMYVSDVDVTKGGEFLSFGNSASSRKGGIKIKNGTTDGTILGSWQTGEYGAAAPTTKYPTDRSANVISYSYLRNDAGAGGKGSAFYLNGAMLGNWGGLKWGELVADIALGGLSSENATFLNVGMKIHRVQIYAGELTIEQLAVAEASIKETPVFPLVETATPAAGDGKWYYIKSQRSASVGGVSSALNAPNWWTLQADGKVKPQALASTENQLFQLTNAAAGKVTFNAKNGNTASIDGDKIVFTGTTPVSTGWTLTPNVVNDVLGFAFPGEGSGVHQGASGANWEIMTWYSITDNCTFFFYEATDDFAFRAGIEAAKSILSSTKIGTSLGFTSQENADIYLAAIKEAMKTVGSTDPEAMAAAKAILDQATATFNASKIQLVSSTNENPVYYYIASKQPNYAKDKVIYTTGATTQCMWGGNETPTLNMLFRVEKHATNNTYRIVNAAFPSGELVSENYGTTNNSYWNIQELIGNEGPQYKITKGTILHAQQSGNKVVNWDGGYNSASAWTFEPFTGDLSTLYQVQYSALVDEYNTLVDADGNAIGYTLGTAVGNYSQEAFDAVKVAYNAMKVDFEDGGATIATTIGNLTTAIATFKTSIVLPKPFNGTIDPTGKYSLKYINAGSSFNGFYLNNPRTDEFNDQSDEASRPQANLVETFSSNTCLWYIAASTTQGKHLLLSTRRENEYLDENGRVRNSSSFGDNIWTTKTLLQSEDTWNDESSYLVIKIDENGAYYNSDATTGELGRNNNTWSYYKLEKVTSVSLDEATQTIRPIVINGAIQIDGTDSIDLYSTTGTKVQNKNLKAGLYVAKKNGSTYKVVVK